MIVYLITYPKNTLIKHTPDYFQLRYSLRSVDKHLSEYPIFVIGPECPSWLVNVNFIQCNDNQNNKSSNIINKILQACKVTEISQTFLLMADDYFILKTFNIYNIPTYCRFSKQTNILTPYTNAVKITNTYLKQNFNITHPKRFDIHYPGLVNKKKCIEIFNNIPWQEKKLLFKIIYYNLINSNPYYIEDCKVNDLPQINNISFSTTSKISTKTKQFIMDLYPEESKYEKS